MSLVQAATGTFGTTTVGGSGTTFWTGMPRATQYTPGSSGTVTDVMLYLTISGAGGHAQVAIYANNGNAPGALLAKSSSDTITSNGWHDFSGFNVAVSGGTPYWLACEADSGNLLWYYNNGGANYYQGSGYGYGTFPNPYTRASIWQLPNKHLRNLHQFRFLTNTNPDSHTYTLIYTNSNSHTLTNSHSYSIRVLQLLLEQQQLADQAQHSTLDSQEQPSTHLQAPEQ